MLFQIHYYNRHYLLWAPLYKSYTNRRDLRCFAYKLPRSSALKHSEISILNRSVTCLHGSCQNTVDTFSTWSWISTLPLGFYSLSTNRILFSFPPFHSVSISVSRCVKFIIILENFCLYTNLSPYNIFSRLHVSGTVFHRQVLSFSMFALYYAVIIGYTVYY